MLVLGCVPGVKLTLNVPLDFIQLGRQLAYRFSIRGINRTAAADCTNNYVDAAIGQPTMIEREFRSHLGSAPLMNIVGTG